MMIFAVVALGLYAIMAVGTYKLTMRLFDGEEPGFVVKAAVLVLSVMWPVSVFFTGVKEALK